MTDKSAGFGFFGIMVKCSVFQVDGHVPVSFMPLKMDVIGLANARG